MSKTTSTVESAREELASFDDRLIGPATERTTSRARCSTRW